MLRRNFYVIVAPNITSQTFTSREAARRFARRLLGRRPSWPSVRVARLRIADGGRFVAVPAEVVTR
jgi:hypothetical protein